MTEQIQTDWEKEFEKFEYIGIALDWFMMNAYSENRKPGRKHLEDVKQFIKGVVDQAQQQERQRVIEEVENRKLTIKWLWGKQETDDDCFLMVMEQVQKIAEFVNSTK